MSTIAIIDDDEPVRTGLASLVRSLGYSVSVFASAEAFLAAAHHAECGCLITDVQMPGMNGLDLQRALVAAGLTIPVIFITAFPEDRIRAVALAAGATCFLSKPFEADALDHALAAVCAGRPP